MLPISDDNSGRRIMPVVTWVLIAINVLVYLYQWSLGQGRAHNEFLWDWAVIPDRISNGEAYHTLITCAFLHGSWFHLGSNMLFLWIFGDNVEDVMGHVKFIIFYLLCAIAAAAAQIMIAPHSEVPMVGASGAIAGVLGAYLILFPKGRIRTLIPLGGLMSMTMLPALAVIGMWFVLQLVSGLTSLGQVGDASGGVAFFAHIGGFIAGLVLVFLFRNRQRQDEQNAARITTPDRQQIRFGSGRR